MTFECSKEERVRWREHTYNAAKEGRYAVFRLVPDTSKALKYSLEYSWQPPEWYTTISHAWTDRSGPGDSVPVDDLAPWCLTMSPIKTRVLDWLYDMQHQVSGGDDWWFWLDLLCIDQSGEDERFFAFQIQQINIIFEGATGCLALLASRPCKAAQQFDLSKVIPTWGEYFDAAWEGLLTWAEKHQEVCHCSPFIDAWLTRVWTRQELLYSKRIIFCSVLEWGKPDEHILDEKFWTKEPTFYSRYSLREGFDELDNCLTTWAHKNAKSFMPDEISSAALALMTGKPLELSVSSLADQVTPAPTLEDWFAFNWSRALNGSVRRTTWAADAILSQMLLLPGYVVPKLPRSLSLQEIADDASIQFRKLVRTDQLVPRNICTWVRDSNIIKRNTLQQVDQPMMSGILEQVGFPHRIVPVLDRPWSNARGGPKQAKLLMESQQPYTIDSEAPLIAYEPLYRPRYEIRAELDIVNKPFKAALFFCDYLQLWEHLHHHATQIRVRQRLVALFKKIEGGQTADADPADFQKALEDIVWGMLGDDNIKQRHDFELPPLRGARVTYDQSPGHIGLVLGDIPVGTEGPVFSLGKDGSHGLETGIIAEKINDKEVKFRASGPLLLFAGPDDDAQGRDTTICAVRGPS